MNRDALCAGCPLRRIGLRHVRDVANGYGGLVVEKLAPGGTLATKPLKPSYAFLRSGALKIEAVSPEGTADIIGFAFSGEPVVVSHADAPVVVTALRPTEICRLSASAVLSRDDGAAEILSVFCASALEHAIADQQRLARARRGDAATRLSWFLSDMADRTGTNEVDLCMSREDIALYLALRSESVSRGFATLETCRSIKRTTVRTVIVGTGTSVTG